MENNMKLDGLTFEQAIELLEKIVGDLEVKNLSLEEAVEAFEKGIKLSKYCNEKLNKAEGKINMLIKKEDKTVTEVPFAINEEE